MKNWFTLENNSFDILERYLFLDIFNLSTWVLTLFFVQEERIYVIIIV